MAALAGSAGAAEPTPFFNGFEVDLTGWPGAGLLAASRVASGTNGITSADGSWHGSGANSFTRFGPGASVFTEFPEHGFTVSLDIYLDVNGGFANDTRFDWAAAHNKTDINTFVRDWVFNGGFYNDTDVTGSGNRFVISTSNSATRANAYPKDPARDPFAITSTGWYWSSPGFVDT